MAASPPPEPAARARRPRIRTQLLAVLLPAVVLLLGLDSWHDYRDMSRAIDTAYDQALVEPLIALDESVRINAAGEIDLATPFAVQSMFESSTALHKHLHVGLTPLDALLAPERTLLGVDDLPTTGIASAVRARDDRGNPIVFYDAEYRGYTVRIALLRRTLPDAAGRLWQLTEQAAESNGRRMRARQDILRRELWQDARMLALTALIVWLGLAWTLRPLQRLRAALRARAPGDLRPLDAPRDVPGEVMPLVDAVNHHIADHRRLLDQQAQFLADASHQLRTPLAIMTAQAGYALRETAPQQWRETLQAMAAQLERSRRLSDQLLSMAHAQQAPEAAQALGADWVDLGALARDAVLRHLALAREKGQDLGWAAACGGAQEEPPVRVRAQALELQEALANLVHNAICHVPAGGRITVAAGQDGGRAFAQVCDDGPGIAPAQREAVFQRLRRAGGSGGAGLGLAIARAYARRNGGDIVLADGEARPDGGHGLCARLVLPVGQSAPEHS